MEPIDPQIFQPDYQPRLPPSAARLPTREERSALNLAQPSVTSEQALAQSRMQHEQARIAEEERQKRPKAS